MAGFEDKIMENVVIYEWCDGRNRWHAFNPFVSNFIEQNCQDGMKNFNLGSVDRDFRHLDIDLETMKQKNVKSERLREIRRETYNPDMYTCKGAVWEFEGDDTWEVYDKASSEALEKAFQSDVEEAEISTSRSQAAIYSINFTAMTQTRKGTKKVRSISRTPHKYIYMDDSKTSSLRRDMDRVSLKSETVSHLTKRTSERVAETPTKQKSERRRSDRRQKCEYQILSEAFKIHLDLPRADFLGRHDKCYCKKCYTSAAYLTVGDPARQFSIPKGWYRFSLRAPARATSLEAFKNWNRAFHGTTQAKLKSILHVGEIVPAGRSVLGGTKVSERDGHYTPISKPTGFDTQQVFVSPSITYAGVDAYASPERFSNDGKEYSAKVAFQVLIDPNSFTIGPQTIGQSSRIDPAIQNEELEWMTNQQGSTILYGLLVKLE